MAPTFRRQLPNLRSLTRNANDTKPVENFRLSGSGPVCISYDCINRAIVLKTRIDVLILYFAIFHADNPICPFEHYRIVSNDNQGPITAVLDQ